MGRKIANRKTFGNGTGGESLDNLEGESLDNLETEFRELANEFDTSTKRWIENPILSVYFRSLSGLKCLGAFRNKVHSFLEKLDKEHGYYEVKRRVWKDEAVRATAECACNRIAELRNKVSRQFSETVDARYNQLESTAKNITFFLLGLLVSMLTSMQSGCSIGGKFDSISQKLDSIYRRLSDVAIIERVYVPASPIIDDGVLSNEDTTCNRSTMGVAVDHQPNGITASTVAEDSMRFGAAGVELKGTHADGKADSD